MEHARPGSLACATLRTPPESVGPLLGLGPTSLPSGLRRQTLLRSSPGVQRPRGSDTSELCPPRLR
eukprot:8471204-Alexandrium_andersonii.AAC.1